VVSFGRVRKSPLKSRLRLWRVTCTAVCLMARHVGGEARVPDNRLGLRLVCNSNRAPVVPVRPPEDHVAESGAEADRLFTGLDGREVTVRSRHWRIEVYSTWEQTDRRWIQLALRGEDGSPDYMLTLRLAATDGVRHAILTLSSWLAGPGKSREILQTA